MKRIIITISGALVAVLAVGLAGAAGSQADEPDWAAPNTITAKRVTGLSPYQNQPVLFSNLDCTPTSYRLANSSSMRVGCFTQTAFGQLNSDDGTIIYNSSDEAVPLLPNIGGSEVFAPWPQAGALLALDPAVVSGTYVSLYREPMAVALDQHNSLGEVSAKKLSKPPDMTLLAPDGRPLIINPQTLAFSDGGSWLAAEDLNGSFVRYNLDTLEALPFAPAYGTIGSPGLLQSQVAISRNGRFVAINNEAAGAFKVYDLAACASQTTHSLAPLNCRSYDYRYFVSQRIPGLRYIRHVRFVNDGLVSFEAYTSSSVNDGTYELAPRPDIGPLINYMGMGDSYTSGEGAFNYVNGTDTGGDNCHLSINSYPVLLTHDLFGSQGGHSVACSGAKIPDIGDLGPAYRGQVQGVPSWYRLQADDPEMLSRVLASFMPGYIAQERFVKQYQPAVSTVSIGGNDIGFGNILTECVEPQLSLRSRAQDCFSSYEDRLEVKNLIDRTIPRWTRLYRSLLQAAPGMRLYAVGYPQIAYGKGSCALNVHLSQSELEFANAATDYLDGAISQAAAAAGVSYVDIKHALDGHRLCEAASYDVAVNGLTSGKDRGLLGVNFLGKESYHPNALGQHLIEEAIIEQTNRLASSPSGVENYVLDSASLLNAPKTGRQAYVLEPQSGMTAPVVSAGETISVKLDGVSNGLRPNSLFSVHLDGPAKGILGSVTSSGSGDISGTLTIPDSAAAGGHVLDVTGYSEVGEPVDASQPIYIKENDIDADGDGVADSHDSCPYSVNSGQDEDGDSIDDSCDPFIGRPSTINGSKQGGKGVSAVTADVPPSGQGSPNVSTVTAAGSQPYKAGGRRLKTNRVIKDAKTVSPGATEPQTGFGFLGLPKWSLLVILTWGVLLFAYLRWPSG